MTLKLMRQMIIKSRSKKKEENMMITTLDSENDYNDSFKINNI